MEHNNNELRSILAWLNRENAGDPFSEHPIIPEPWFNLLVLRQTVMEITGLQFIEGSWRQLQWIDDGSRWLPIARTGTLTAILNPGEQKEPVPDISELREGETIVYGAIGDSGIVCSVDQIGHPMPCRSQCLEPRPEIGVSYFQIRLTETERETLSIDTPPDAEQTTDRDCVLSVGTLPQAIALFLQPGANVCVGYLPLGVWGWFGQFSDHVDEELGETQAIITSERFAQHLRGGQPGSGFGKVGDVVRTLWASNPTTRISFHDAEGLYRILVEVNEDMGDIADVTGFTRDPKLRVRLGIANTAQTLAEICRQAMEHEKDFVLERRPGWRM